MIHRLGYVRMAATAAVAAILAVLVLLRLGALSLPRGLVFRLLLALVVLSNVVWAARVDQWLGRLWTSNAAGGRRGVWLRCMWAVYVLAVTSILFLVLLGGKRLWDALPVPLIMWTLTWHLLMPLVAIVMAGGIMGHLAVRLIWWPARRRSTIEAPVDYSRRALLVRSVIAAPLVVVGTSVVGGLAQAGRFRIRRMTMALPRLPNRLRGLTITHLSDFHVGRLFRPEHLPRVVDAVNNLASDLVVVTGDAVDHSNLFLPPVCEAISRLEHRYGRFVVVGNHDLIDSGRELLDYIGHREAHFLCDRHVTLAIGGETIQLAGLFWSGCDQRVAGDPGHRARAEAALAGTDPDHFTIALAHHPHAFDALADRGVDLTLAGHTHGGQVMLTRPGSPRPIGGGNLLFRYIWGEYRRGPAALHVSAGVGNWFPVRINAPAEIVQIQLV